MNAPARIGQQLTPDLLTHDEAAAHLRVCPKTLRTLRQRGLIRYVAITARKKLYRVEDLEDYLASCVTTETCQPTQRRGGKRLMSARNVVSFTARRQERQADRGR